MLTHTIPTRPHLVHIPVHTHITNKYTYTHSIIHIYINTYPTHAPKTYTPNTHTYIPKQNIPLIHRF